MNRVRWSTFYRWLDSKQVRMPEYAPGEPPDLNEIASLLVRVQNSRDDIESRLRRIDQRLGSLRRDAALLAESRRLQRLEAHGDAAVATAKTQRDRDMLADLSAQSTSARLAVVIGTIKEYEAAHAAASRMIQTLQTAKETLNALRSIVLTGADDAESFRSQTWRRRNGIGN